MILSIAFGRPDHPDAFTSPGLFSLMWLAVSTSSENTA